MDLLTRRRRDQAAAVAVTTYSPQPPVVTTTITTTTKTASLTNQLSFFYTLLLILLGLNLVWQTASAQRVLYHSECGESPVVKYKELAKSIGWDFHQLIRFIKFEKPQDYEQILRSVKLYADCVALSQIPLK